MLSVTLGENVYTIDYVTALALREIGRPMEIIKKAEKGQEPADFGRDLDTLVNWFCVLFQNQFKPSEVYEKYPADRLITDITLAALAVNNRVSSVLNAFPTTAAAARTPEPDA